jgi:tetratricopeptide (TPR) repeat protein
MNEERIVASLLRRVDRYSLLSCPDQHIKAPLERIATEVLARTAVLLEAKVPSPDVTNCFNRAAQVQYQYGNLDSADEMCRAAIELCMRCFEVTKNAEWIYAVLQPYVNIGRLEGMRGKTHEALARFRSAFLFVDGQTDFDVNGRCVPAILSEEVRRCDRNAWHVAVNCYVGDSVRACLLNEEYDTLRQFLLECRRDGIERTSAVRKLLEGEVRHCLATGELRRGLDQAVELWNVCKKDNVPDPSILGLLSDIYITGGKRDIAESILSTMASYCDQLAAAGQTDLKLKRALYVLSLRYFFARNFGLAKANASRAVAVAQSLGDESTAIRATCLMAELQSDELTSGDQIFPFLFSFADTTLYRFEQLLAYLELSAANYSPCAGTSLREVYKIKLRQLINRVPRADADLVRAVLADSSAGDHSDASLPAHTLINSSQMIEKVYEVLMDYARHAVAC